VKIADLDLFRHNRAIRHDGSKALVRVVSAMRAVAAFGPPAAAAPGGY
jgi:hypothetical protein